MSYSVDPPQLIGLGERMRRSFDVLDEAARGLQRAAASAALGLVRALPAHGADEEMAGAAEVAASDAAAVTNPFDPIVFGRRRL